MLDVIGVAYRMADTAQVPPRGPVRHWLQALQPNLNDPAIQAARAMGPIPISLLLEVYGSTAPADSACGTIEPGRRMCFTGNEGMRKLVRDFIATGAAFTPRTVGLETVSDEERRRDLADVYVALTRSRSLDSTLAAYSGYTDLSFDITLARTLSTANTVPAMDPARLRGEPNRIFVTPDPVFPTRSFRSPSYIWLTLSHQMAHEVVRRLFAEHPELLAHGFAHRDASSSELARIGYTTVFWDDALGEQLARTISIRILSIASPSILWAARTDASSNSMSLVPWLEDALIRYERERSKYPTLGSFAGELANVLDSVPFDSCRAAPVPHVALIGTSRHRAVVGWMGDDSPFRSKRLLVGDTVIAVDNDSVSAGGLLTPTRQVNLAWAQHLPYELGIIDILRGGHHYTVEAPISWQTRLQTRVASMARPAPSDTLPICRWVTRARRH